MRSASDDILGVSEGSGSECNALYYVPTNSFTYKQPEVPIHSFESQRKQMLASRGSSSEIVLDLSDRMGLSYPATTPTLLARYLTVAPHDVSTSHFGGIAEIYYVIEGTGSSKISSAEIQWKQGDAFVLPAEGETLHTAGPHGAVLYAVTDEPLLSHCRASPAARSGSAVSPTHYRAEKIEEYMGVAYDREGSDDEAAKAIFLTNNQMKSLHSTSPFVTANFNTLPAGADQRPHRHNAAALTLSIAGKNVYSKVGGQRVDWSPFGVTVTPPAMLHSHHNRGDRMMNSFVVQDSGLYYYARTAGFSFD